VKEMDNPVFADTLVATILEKKSILVMGVDPDFALMPPDFARQTAEGRANSVEHYFRPMITALASSIVACKLKIAFFERLGVPGMRTFSNLIQHARDQGLLVIADAKRGDIGSTAEAYADAYLGGPSDATSATDFVSDAVTVSPYLGSDSIIPFVRRAESNGKGIFVLVHTSNKSAVEIQDVPTTSDGQDARNVYELVAGLVNKWGTGLVGQRGYSSVGAVVGLTFPDAAKRIRQIVGHCFILVPGYGAQGGQASDLTDFLDEDGLGAIVNSSRAISYAYRSPTWAQHFRSSEFVEAAVAEVSRANHEINSAMERAGRRPW